MKFLKTAILLLLLTNCISCSKSSSSNSSPSTGYLKINVDGKDFEETNTLNIAGTGYGSILQSCNGKDQFKQFHAMIENSTFFFQVGLVHAENAVDFGSPAAGNFNIYTLINFFNNKYCYNNLTFDVEYEDKASDKSYELISGGTHKIISITKVSSDNANTVYSVEGTFTGTYKLVGGTKTSIVNGSYRTFIKVLK
jgi:hypothetical protein